MFLAVLYVLNNKELMVVGLTTSCQEVATDGGSCRNPAWKQAIIDAQINAWKRTEAVWMCMYRRKYRYIRGSHPPLVTASWKEFKFQIFGRKIIALRRAERTFAALKIQSWGRRIVSQQQLIHKIMANSDKSNKVYSERVEVPEAQYMLPCKSFGRCADKFARNFHIDPCGSQFKEFLDSGFLATSFRMPPKPPILKYSYTKPNSWRNSRILKAWNDRRDMLNKLENLLRHQHSHLVSPPHLVAASRKRSELQSFKRKILTQLQLKDNINPRNTVIDDVIEAEPSSPNGEHNVQQSRPLVLQEPNGGRHKPQSRSTIFEGDNGGHLALHSRSMVSGYISAAHGERRSRSIGQLSGAVTKLQSFFRSYLAVKRFRGAKLLGLHAKTGRPGTGRTERFLNRRHTRRVTQITTGEESLTGSMVTPSAGPERKLCELAEKLKVDLKADHSLESDILVCHDDSHIILRFGDGRMEKVKCDGFEYWDVWPDLQGVLKMPSRPITISGKTIETASRPQSIGRARIEDKWYTLHCLELICRDDCELRDYFYINWPDDETFVWVCDINIEEEGAALVDSHEKDEPEMFLEQADQQHIEETRRNIRKTMYDSAHGDAGAQYNLGMMYEKGSGVSQNYDRAVELYTKAANQGHAGAQWWCRKSANQGLAQAQDILGTMYKHGLNVPQDDEHAVHWYKKAADQGYARAQCNLGSMYYNGHGVSQDYGRAVELYRKAANQGHADAQNNLASMYDNGQGVSQDYTRAMEWYKRAADQGHGLAQCNLAYKYYRGHGVSQDIERAVMLYGDAADQGYVVAQLGLARAQQRLNAMMAVSKQSSGKFKKLRLRKEFSTNTHSNGKLRLRKENSENTSESKGLPQLVSNDVHAIIKQSEVRTQIPSYNSAGEIARIEAAISSINFELLKKALESADRAMQKVIDHENIEDASKVTNDRERASCESENTRECHLTRKKSPLNPPEPVLLPALMLVGLSVGILATLSHLCLNHSSIDRKKCPIAKKVNDDADEPTTDDNIILPEGIPYLVSNDRHVVIHQSILRKLEFSSAALKEVADPLYPSRSLQCKFDTTTPTAADKLTDKDELLAGDTNVQIVTSYGPDPKCSKWMNNIQLVGGCRVRNVNELSAFNGFEETVAKTTYDLDEHLVICNFNVSNVGYDRWVRLRGNEQWAERSTDKDELLAVITNVQIITSYGPDPKCSQWMNNTQVVGGCRVRNAIHQIITTRTPQVQVEGLSDDLSNKVTDKAMESFQKERSAVATNPILGHAIPFQTNDELTHNSAQIANHRNDKNFDSICIMPTLYDYYDGLLSNGNVQSWYDAQCGTATIAMFSGHEHNHFIGSLTPKLEHAVVRLEYLGGHLMEIPPLGMSICLSSAPPADFCLGQKPARHSQIFAEPCTMPRVKSVISLEDDVSLRNVNEIAHGSIALSNVSLNPVCTMISTVIDAAQQCFDNSGNDELEPDRYLIEMCSIVNITEPWYETYKSALREGLKNHAANEQTELGSGPTLTTDGTTYVTVYVNIIGIGISKMATPVLCTATIATADSKKNEAVVGHISDEANSQAHPLGRWVYESHGTCRPQGALRSHGPLHPWFSPECTHTQALFPWHVPSRFMMAGNPPAFYQTNLITILERRKNRLYPQQRGHSSLWFSQLR